MASKGFFETITWSFTDSKINKLFLENNKEINIINPISFYDPAHTKVYEVIETLNNKGMIANPITLKNFFEKVDDFKKDILIPELVEMGYSSKSNSGKLRKWIIDNNFPEYFQILCHLFINKLRPSTLKRVLLEAPLPHTFVLKSQFIINLNKKK